MSYLWLVVAVMSACQYTFHFPCVFIAYYQIRSVDIYSNILIGFPSFRILCIILVPTLTYQTQGNTNVAQTTGKSTGTNNQYTWE